MNWTPLTVRVILYGVQKLLALSGIALAGYSFLKHPKGAPERKLSGFLFLEMWFLGALELGPSGPLAVRNELLVVLALAGLLGGWMWQGFLRNAR